MSGLKWTGFGEVQRELAALEQQQESWFKAFLLEQARLALLDIHSRASQDQAIWKNAWRIDTETASLEVVQREGETLTVALINPLAQASEVEYGALSADRGQFVPGRLTCTLALADLEEELPQRFRAAFAQWIGGLK